MDCLFCKLGKERGNKIYEDDLFFIIEDINPKARYHYLAIPRKHYKYLTDMNKTDIEEFDIIVSTIGNLAKWLKLDGGFRLIINQGDDAGQSVPHLHIHILGGEKMDWNPA